MIKKPGSFSQKYMSNPLPRQSHLHKDTNKENKNLNGTFDECDLDFTIAISNSNTPVRKVQEKPRVEAKQRMEWEKKEKQYRQQISRLKKENSRLKQNLTTKNEEIKKSNSINEENICHYESYIKEIQASVQQLDQKKKQYEEYLQFCIIWFVQIFSLSRTPQQHQYLLHHSLSEQSFTQLFQKLKPVVDQLKIQKQLEDISVQTVHGGSYLLCEDQDVDKNEEKGDQFFDDAHSFLDTFDQRRQSSRADYSQVAKKLFDSRSDKNEKSSSSSIKKSTKKQSFSEYVVALRHYQPENDDYLELEVGQEIKLLRKVGDVWIAESGSKIGYIDQSIFNSS